MDEFSPKFKFNYNGVTYTVVIKDLTTALKNFGSASHEYVEKPITDFSDAKKVIEQIKSKL